ncbi:MAG: hypothetical protein HFACDABA_00319 [Anaerolineales bacterium]|nr:hypothetical protein [Anaerolineales bacterium]
MHPARNSWKQLALFILGLLGFLFCVGGSAIVGLGGLLNIASPDAITEAAQPLALGVMFLSIGMLLAPGALSAFRRMSGREESQSAAHLPFRLWHIPLLISLWLGSLLLGQWAAEAAPPAWILLPLLIPLCVIPPIWLAVGLAGRGYNFNPRWRSWNAFNIGATLGPFLILVAEMITLGILFFIVIVFIASQPDLFRSLEALALRLQSAHGEEEVLAAIGPLVTSPLAIGIILFAVSLLVPLIEEALKPLAVWFFARQLNTRLDGFALGAISGAAYSLFETGGIGSAAGGDWLALLGARGGTSLLHIAASAWMGSAIVPAIHERKWLQLLGVYASVVALHGTWNALSVFNGFGIAAEGQPGGRWLLALAGFSAYGLAALAALFLALLLHQQNRFSALHNQPLAATLPGTPAASIVEPPPTHLQT